MRRRRRPTHAKIWNRPAAGCVPSASRAAWQRCADATAAFGAQWADDDQCARNKGFMMGSFGAGGKCVRSCCLPQVREGVADFECKPCDGVA